VAFEFRLPDLGEGLQEGEVARWLVREGEHVEEDAPLVEIQTDKTTVEIPSPAAGTVTSILVAEGEIVPVGTVLVVIGDGTVAPAPAPPTDRVRATPRVRAVAREHGVDLAAVTPTGPNGRVTEQDVLRGRAGERRVPLRGVRRQIAEHLARAHREIPAVTFVEECDFTALAAARGEGSYVPYVLQAAARTLRELPELNAWVEGEELVLHDRVDLGLAVQTEQGLVVPVVRGADRLDVDELAAESRRLSEAAREGRLRPDELRGSTFTVTSAGRLGGLFVTPLVNHPEVAILGLHRIAPRPVVRDGGIHVREIGNVSVTFDHRAVDGAQAAEFALAVIRRLESP
jgi:pyruvate/2-oxoglutarate dehydrogenase complex dihydrolipoamide acyltransferase (E2) component